MKNPAPLTIMIVDDHYIVRMGLAAILRMEPDIGEVTEAEDGAQALACFRVHRPDVTLMDLRMPGMSGIEAISAIRAEFPEARILMLTTFDGEEDVFRAMEAGAAGYLLKDVPGGEMLSAIRQVHAGGSYMDEVAAKRLAEREPGSTLTAREMEVLEVLAKGLSNREIAGVFGFTHHTAKAHVESIIHKLGAADRTEAATMAVRRGILHLS